MTKRTRTADMVEITEIEPLLNRLRNAGLAEREIIAGIGYSSGNLTDWRKTGLVRRSVKLALAGFILERGIEAGAQKSRAFTLSFEEAELLFLALSKVRPAMPSRAAELQKLSAKVAGHLASGSP